MTNLHTYLKHPHSLFIQARLLQVELFAPGRSSSWYEIDLIFATSRIASHHSDTFTVMVHLRGKSNRTQLRDTPFY